MDTLSARLNDTVAYLDNIIVEKQSVGKLLSKSTKSVKSEAEQKYEEVKKECIRDDNKKATKSVKSEAEQKYEEVKTERNGDENKEAGEFLALLCFAGVLILLVSREVALVESLKFCYHLFTN
nr:unnamed protein product [Haemonchus contortus]